MTWLSMHKLPLVGLVMLMTTTSESYSECRRLAMPANLYHVAHGMILLHCVEADSTSSV